MLALYTLFALDMLNMSLFLPVFNKYVISLGGSHGSIGLIGSISAAISLIWKPVAGGLSDTKGRRKIILWCITLCLIGNILTYLFKSLYVLIFARVLCAFGSPMQTLLKTAVCDTATKPGAEGVVFNKIGAIFPICFMGGAVLGGFLSEYPNGFDLVILLISLNLIISFFLANLLPSGKSTLVATEHASTFSISEKFENIYKSVKNLNWAQYWDIFAIKGILDLSFGLMQMNMGLVLLKQFNIDGRYMGYIFCLVGVVSMITNLTFVKLNNTYYKKDKGYLRTLHGSTLLALSYFGLGMSPMYTVFLCFLITMMIARSILDPTLLELLTNKVNDGEKGKIISLFDGTLSLTELVAPLFSTILVSFYGEQRTILLCSILAMIGSGIAYIKRHDNVKLHTS